VRLFHCSSLPLLSPHDIARLRVGTARTSAYYLLQVGLVLLLQAEADSRRRIPQGMVRHPETAPSLRILAAGDGYWRYSIPYICRALHSVYVRVCLPAGPSTPHASSALLRAASTARPSSATLSPPRPARTRELPARAAAASRSATDLRERRRGGFE
jgi:hypothetical protein